MTARVRDITDLGDEVSSPSAEPDPAAAEAGAPAVSDADADAAGAGPSDDACEQCGEYLESLTRLKAEFTNYRRRAGEQQAQAAERGAADLASRLLPVLDACEAGAVHHDEVVGPLHSALVGALVAEGLQVISPQDEAFDPAYHEAVTHETAGTPGRQVVTEVLRTGYAWGGRVLRPAVVGVRG